VLIGEWVRLDIHPDTDDLTRQDGQWLRCCVDVPGADRGSGKDKFLSQVQNASSCIRRQRRTPTTGRAQVERVRTFSESR